MKSKLVLLGLLTISFSSIAQNVHFGVKTGLNVSMLFLSGSIPSGGTTSSSTGFIIGGEAEFKIDNKFSIQPELIFSTDGGKYQYTNNISSNSSISYNYSQTIEMNSISLPVVAKFYLNDELSFDAGLQLNYLLSAKSNLNYNSQGLTITGSNDMENNQSLLLASTIPVQKVTINHNYDLNKLNFGFVIGTTYKLKNGFFFQARYNLAITSFTKNANVLSGTESTTGADGDNRYKGATLKNASFQLALGYKFK